MEDNIRCDYLIITDGKDMTQKSAHLINDTLRTLTSQPKVLVRNIHDQGKQKDKIRCKKVMFFIHARVSFFQLLLNWLNSLPEITNGNRQVSVLIQEQDTEIGDRSDIDHAISEINQEKGIDMMNWISSFNDISSWWSLIIKFLFKVKRFGNDDFSYNLVFAVPEMKDSKTVRTLSDILSSFKLKESASSEYIVRVANEHQGESVTDVHTGINIGYKIDDCKLSIALLAVLLDLKVIKAKQTKQITRTIHTKIKPSYRILTCLINILLSILFVLACLLNLPFFGIHVPFTCYFTFCFPPFSFIFPFLLSAECDCKISTYGWKRMLAQNIFVIVMFGILAGALSIFNSWISILIGIYTFVWPILLHNILCKNGFDYGVVSLPLKVWDKIDFGLLRILYQQFKTVREEMCAGKIRLILNRVFMFIHSPVIILYLVLFLIVLKILDSKQKIIALSIFYTNFALALGFGIAGLILLHSQISLVAITLIIMSIYTFFFLCVLHIYCWRAHNLKYGIFSN